MKRTLVILSPARLSSRCVEWAISSAEKDEGELLAVYILDTAASDQVQERLEDLGFLGKTPSIQFKQAMRREQERQAKRELERIRSSAEQRSIKCRTMLVEGDFLDMALEVAEGESPDAIFVARRDRPRLSRLVSRSKVNDLKASAPCQVTVVDRPEGEDEGGTLTGSGG